MLDRLYGQGAAYNVACPYRLVGALDFPRLQRAFDTIVQRHEVLRTYFQLENDDVVQAVLPRLDVPISLHDLGDVAPDRRFAIATERAAVEFARPFDLSAAPLLRADLYRVSEQEHLLAMCVHHAVFDGWSESVFLDELSALYAGTPLDAPPIQYRQFAIDQRQKAGGAAAQASLALWRERLADAPAALNLPLDFSRPAAPTRRGGQVDLRLPRECVDALNALGRRRGATLFMTLLAAYGVVLHRYSGDREVMIGTVLAGRTHPDLERLIGFFINTVALRVDFGGHPTFVELLEAVKRSSLESYSHQDVPFEHVVESVHPSRGAGQMPFFQTIFVLQNGTSRARGCGGLRIEPLSVHNRTSKCDLVLSVADPRDGGDGLCCSLEYDADLFEPRTIERLLESYRTVLEAVGAEPDQSIATIPIVGDTDRALLERWSDTAVPYPRESTIHREFERVADRTPSAVAMKSDVESVTYGELDARANRLAARLRREGVQRGELVALCLERSVDAIVAQLAVLKAGGAYLPLDAAYPSSRLSFMIRDARARIVLSHAGAAQRLPRGDATIILLDREADALAGESSGRLAVEIGGEDLAYVMYTSGSTGRPNGVRIPHRGVLRLILGSDYVCWDNANTFLQMAPLSFDASTFEVWGPLLHGRRLVVLPERVPTVPILDAALRREAVDCLWLTSAFFNAVVDERPECLSGVRQLIVGGEALSVPHVRLAQARLPSTQLINGYGPTESTTFACCHRIPPLDGSDVAAIPIGRPIANTSVLVLDARRQPVPVGVMGEIYIGGDGVALGYHDRPALTAERFVADPAGKSPGRWYRTGDRARWNADGHLEFHGRFDAQLKIRGFRVEPGEIEAACRQHPGVRDASVVADARAATDARLVAFIVGEPGQTPAAEDLKRFLGDQLPAHLVPTDVAVLDALPLTPNGKVDRHALSSMRREHGHAPAAAAAAPRTPVEKALSEIWRDLLGLDAVGIHEDFFALGGHSLLAVRMFSRIHATFGRTLPFSTLLRHSTIAELSILLETPAPTPTATPGQSLVPLKREGRRPPLFLLHGIGNEMWLFGELVKHVDAEQPVYGLLPTDEAASRAAALPERVAGYVADLEALLPHGPFVVGGHCSGAVAAFEVARQLRARGHRVPLLVVFDYWLDEVPIGVGTLLANAATWVADDLLQASVSHNVGRVRSRLRLLTARLKRAAGDRTPAGDVRDRLGLWRFPAYEVARLQRDMDAVSAYRFGEYDGSIHVFRARTRALSRRHPAADMGWRRVTTGPLTIETVPGSHDTMLRAPFARMLGARLDAALERAFQDAGPRAAAE